MSTTSFIAKCDGRQQLVNIDASGVVTLPRGAVIQDGTYTIHRSDDSPGIGFFTVEENFIADVVLYPEGTGNPG